MRNLSKIPGILAAISTLCLFSGTAAIALSQAGTQQDPLVSLSYIENTYEQEQIQQIQTLIQQKLDAAQASAMESLSELQNNYTDEQIERRILDQIAATMGSDAIKTNQSYANGTKIQFSLGSEFCLRSGSASVYHGELINLSTGEAVAAGTALVRNQLYFSPDAQSSIQCTSPTQMILVGDFTPIAGQSPTYSAQYTAYADALSDLGLFSGSDVGYELERVSTRAEGLVMLLRLFGEESRAASYQGAHPFTDVPAWADRYVAYAYEKGYTSGMSATEYGSSYPLTLRDYMTFLLRALGYQDSQGDFSWEQAASFAVAHGILTQSECNQIQQRGEFYRDDVVYTSYQTLFLNCKGESTRLCDKLLQKGVFTQTQLSLVQSTLSE